MKILSCLILSVLGMFVSHAKASISIVEEGTLTLSGDKVIFKVGDRTEEYDLTKIPGLKAIKFESRSKMEGSKEIDISRLILFCPQNKKKITLIAHLSTAVSHHVVYPGVPDTWTALK